MKFRDEEVDTIVIKTSDKEKIIEDIKSLGKTHIIIDIQYGFFLDSDFAEWHSVLILARRK